MRGIMPRFPVLCSVVLATITAQVSSPVATAAPSSRLAIVPVDTEPREGRNVATPAEMEALRKDVAEHPDDRTKRLALVRALVVAKDLDKALVEARAWRAKDAYNLVAVRALGDVLMDRGDKAEAERVYSAIVELLPKDPDAQRALATLLKQRGDFDAARERLVVASESRVEDTRIAFELADVELRLGKTDSASTRLEKIIAGAETPEQIRYPARQRLGQILGDARRRAKTAGDETTVKTMNESLKKLDLKGALENDIHVYLTWDTDRTDVDLWIVTPSGEKVFYGHKKGKNGEALFDDVTTGYGPESFTVEHAQAGGYEVQVNYFSGRRGAFPEARGEVIVVVDEGKPTEQKRVLPYRLFAEKQTVTVAKVHVGSGK